ncbi:MAG: hypothetical protein OEL89_02605 [Candidatus Peregrinibacteria bacterium]|nr:hypothetical protein [Candidatus Peregrinibacteria bacterium]
MSFSVHTFEIGGEGKGFAFHENIGEGQDIYFLGKFPEGILEPKLIAESIFGEVVSSLESSKIIDNYDKFEDALKAGNMEGRKHLGSSQLVPEIVIALFDFHNLYLTQSGTSEAYLVRGTNVSQISETPESGDDLFKNILSGQVTIGDTVLLATNRVLRFVTTAQLADVFSRDNFIDAVNIFRHKLSTASDEDMLVTAIGIGKKDEAPSGSGFLSKVVSKVAGQEQSEQEGVSPAETPKPKVQDDIVDDFVVEDQEEPAKPVQPVQSPEPLPEQQYASEQQFSEQPVAVERGPGLIQKIKNFRPKKNLLIIAGVLIGLFLLVLGIRAISGYESADVQVMREELSIAREALVQADAFLLQGERQSASEYLQKAETSVQSILSSKSKNFRSDAQFLLADIQEKKLQVENAKKVIPQLLADLGVKNDNLEASGLLHLKGNLFVHDLRNVYKTVRNIVEKGLPISDKETILASSTREDQNSILFITDSPRIVEYREGLITPMGTEDETWKTGIDIRTYGRYAYILDPVENQIWKYERRRTKYSPASAYNKGADLSRAVSFAIDGAIYILSDDGTLQKLFRGEKANYAFKELPSTPFSGKNLKIYTSAELDFIYVLDPDNSRILVFVKGDNFATYKKQIIFDLPDARDFFIDNSGQRANVLTKDKIYEFSL